MPIRVQMPNGTVRPFREGTPQSVIRKAQADMLADMEASGHYDDADLGDWDRKCAPDKSRKVMVTQALAPDEQVRIPSPGAIIMGGATGPDLNPGLVPLGPATESTLVRQPTMPEPAAPPTSARPPSAAWSEDHGRRVYIRRPDGTVEMRTGGTLTWRNNNPGNLRSSGSEIGGNDSVYGRLAIFADPDSGDQAQQGLLFGPAYGKLTIEQAISKYAPPKENDTASYIRSVTRKTGMSPNQVLGQMTPEQQRNFMNAMRTQEGYQEGAVTILGGTPDDQ